MDETPDEFEALLKRSIDGEMPKEAKEKADRWN